MAFVVSPVAYESGRIVYFLVRNPAGLFLRDSDMGWGELTASAWPDFAHQAFETPEGCGLYGAEVDDSSFDETAPGHPYDVFYYAMLGSWPSCSDLCIYADIGRHRAGEGELDASALYGAVLSVKAKTDGIPTLLSLRAPNFSSSCYELAQYTTPLLVFTVADVLGAPVNLAGRTLALRVQYGWGGRTLFTKSDADFDKSEAALGRVAVRLQKTDTAWTGRIRGDMPFQGELFDVTGGGEVELGRFVVLLRPSHAREA